MDAGRWRSAGEGKTTKEREGREERRTWQKERKKGESSEQRATAAVRLGLQRERITRTHSARPDLHSNGSSQATAVVLSRNQKNKRVTTKNSSGSTSAQRTPRRRCCRPSQAEEQEEERVEEGERGRPCIPAFSALSRKAIGDALIGSTLAVIAMWHLGMLVFPARPSLPSLSSSLLDQDSSLAIKQVFGGIADWCHLRPPPFA